MRFIAAGDDIRPAWPMQQLATLVPHGIFATVPGVPHDFWHTDPQVWIDSVTNACTESHASEGTAHRPSAHR